MEPLTLDDFMALNDQLAALAEAGVPVELGLNRVDDDPAKALEMINAAVARRVSRGESLTEVIAENEAALPESYRSMVQLGLSSGNLYAALDSANKSAEAVEESRYRMQSALLYPLVVCLFAVAGLAVYCALFVPAMSNLHESLRIPAGTALRISQALRGALPLWIAIPPIVLLVLLVQWLRNKMHPSQSTGRMGGLFAHMPGMSRVQTQRGWSDFASTLAALLESGTPLDEGVRLAAEASASPQVSDAAADLAAALEHKGAALDDSVAAKKFPPFLRWALIHSEPTTERPKALRMAGSIYRDSAQRRADRVQALAPIAACVILGGGVTLLYGLALFVPVVDMLKALAFQTT